MIAETSKQYPMKIFNIIQNPFKVLPPTLPLLLHRLPRCQGVVVLCIYEEGPSLNLHSEMALLKF